VNGCPVPDRDLNRLTEWFIERPGWHVITPENGYAKDGRWHAVRGGQRFVGDTLGELMDQLETLA
jgi:hypothetical protein